MHFANIPNTPLKTFGRKYQQFLSGNYFYPKICITFCCQYAQLSNAVSEKVHLNLIISFPRIKLQTHYHSPKKVAGKLFTHSFCALIN